MKQTKKDRAYALFSQGYLPLSKEIKDLGLYPSNRYKYFYEWEAAGKPPGLEPRRSAGTKSSAGDSIGVIDETKAKPKPKAEPKVGPEPEPKEKTPEGIEGEDEGIEGEDEDIEPREVHPEKPKEKAEAIGVVNEGTEEKGKGKGEAEHQEKKIATRVADDGIKCSVFLSLQTLALFKIAASTQAQHDGEEGLNLGDFLDTCAEDFFKVRGRKLGLISTGGK